ncbi:MAG: DNRLRE domain-containing protein [Myxococcota bacterium]
MDDVDAVPPVDAGEDVVAETEFPGDGESGGDAKDADARGPETLDAETDADEEECVERSSHVPIVADTFASSTTPDENYDGTWLLVGDKTNGEVNMAWLRFAHPEDVGIPADTPIVHTGLCVDTPTGVVGGESIELCVWQVDGADVCDDWQEDELTWNSAKLCGGTELLGCMTYTQHAAIACGDISDVDLERANLQGLVLGERNLTGRTISLFSKETDPDNAPRLDVHYMDCEP